MPHDEGDIGVSRGGPMVRSRCLMISFAAVVASLALTAHSLFAQQVRRQVIVGAVRDSAGESVLSGEVFVTAAQTFAVSRGTIAAGRFRIVVDSGTGDFLVTAAAPGFQSSRQRATTGMNSDSVVLIFVLRRASPTALATVAVSARRPQARDINAGLGPRGGAQEQIISETVGALGPGEAGDLAASATLNPGLISVSGGVGAMGLGAEQSRFTLNGQTTLTSVMPRDMRRRVRSGTTNYDPAIGGFSAALVSVELLRGLSLSQPVLRVSQEGEGGGLIVPNSRNVTGPRSELSYAATGEARPGKVYYNIGGAVTYRAKESLRFAQPSGSALDANGIDAEAARRALGAAGAHGVPVTTRTSTRDLAGTATVLGRIDWIDTRWGPLALTVGAGSSRFAPSLTPLENGTREARSSSTNASLQLSSNRQTSGGWLLDWRLGGQAQVQSENPRSRGPSLMVQVPADSSSEVFFGFGGTGRGQESSARAVLDASWQVERMADLPGRGTHQIKLFAQQQSDVLMRRTDVSSGAFRFTTLESWEGRQPASYERVLVGATRQVAATNLAFGFGDVWRPSRFLLVQLGLRAELGGVLRPTRAESLLQRSQLTGATLSGSRFQPLLSPRLGFAWTYRRQRAETPSLQSTGAFGTVAFPGNGTLRGGIGLFRTYWNVDELIATTGFSPSSRLVNLRCGARDVPAFNWVDDPADAPSSCVGTEGARTGLATGAVLPTRAVPPAAWRGNLTLSHGLSKTLTVELGTELSYGVHQRSILDLNLPSREGSTLPFEAQRQSYLSSEAVDPTSGTPREALARPVSGAGPVLDLRADGRNRAARVTLAILPEQWRGWLVRLNTSVMASERFGLDYLATGATLRPLSVWTPTANQPRGRTVLEIGRTGRRLAVGGLILHEFGARFTPLISGDVNGDGVALNDRAFVDAATLLSSEFRRFPGASQQCLHAQAERIASVASCDAPARVRADLSLTLSPEPPAIIRRGGGRTTLTLRVTNVPALLDQVLHREPRGWAASGAVDPVLLSVRSYNPVTRRYGYALNPNFGRPAFDGITRRAPYLVSVDARIFLGGSIADQEAARTLKTSRVGGGRDNSLEDATAKLRGTFADPYLATLEAGDTLLLQRAQVEAIQREQRSLSAAVDSVWRAAAARLTARDGQLSAPDAGALLQQTYLEVIRRMRTGVQPLRTILTPPQLQRVPSDVAALLAGKDPLYRLR
jgi:hypothetical protein